MMQSPPLSPRLPVLPGQRLLALAALTAALITAAPRAEAHPHIFVDATTGFTFDDQNRLAALRITWLYDAFTTLVLYDQLGLDQDGDGALDAADLAKVAEGETTWEPGYPGDTYLTADGKPVAMGKPVNGTARMIGDQVEVTFDLPLASPLPAKGHDLSLKLYDPSYYYAYTVKTALKDGIPAPCGVTLIPFKASSADKRIQQTLAALSREQIPDDPRIGARFADEVVLSCK